MTNQERAERLAQKIAAQIARGAGKGLNAARVFLTARIKETLSVPAPRAAIRGIPLPGKKKGPVLGYRATTPATPGAPPRKLSGRLRSSVVSVMVDERTAVIGANARSVPSRRYPQGFNYPMYHEVKQPQYRGSGKHRFMAPTAKKWKGALAVIIGQTARAFVIPK